MKTVGLVEGLASFMSTFNAGCEIVHTALRRYAFLEAEPGLVLCLVVRMCGDGSAAADPMRTGRDQQFQHQPHQSHQLHQSHQSQYSLEEEREGDDADDAWQDEHLRGWIHRIYTFIRLSCGELRATQRMAAAAGAEEGGAVALRLLLAVHMEPILAVEASRALRTFLIHTRTPSSLRIAHRPSSL